MALTQLSARFARYGWILATFVELLIGEAFAQEPSVVAAKPASTDVNSISVNNEERVVQQAHQVLLNAMQNVNHLKVTDHSGKKVSGIEWETSSDYCQFVTNSLLQKQGNIEFPKPAYSTALLSSSGSQLEDQSFGGYSSLAEILIKEYDKCDEYNGGALVSRGGPFGGFYHEGEAAHGANGIFGHIQGLCDFCYNLLPIRENEIPPFSLRVFIGRDWGALVEVPATIGRKVRVRTFRVAESGCAKFDDWAYWPETFMEGLFVINGDPIHYVMVRADDKNIHSLRNDSGLDDLQEMQNLLVLYPIRKAIHGIKAINDYSPPRPRLSSAMCLITSSASEE